MNCAIGRQGQAFDSPCLSACNLADSVLRALSASACKQEASGNELVDIFDCVSEVRIPAKTLYLPIAASDTWLAGWPPGNDKEVFGNFGSSSSDASQ